MKMTFSPIDKTLKVLTIPALIILSLIIIATKPIQAEERPSGSAGHFQVALSYQTEYANVDVFYYLGRGFTETSPVIIVLPGGGRNGDDYRDAWKRAADRFGLLVLSPSYAEESYPGPLNYNLGRIVARADRRSLDDMQLRQSPTEWIFKDFDQIFDAAKSKLATTQAHYDVFGHSAGGQIAHRLALFNPNSKAKRIVSANAGWYTTADFDLAFPFGLKGAPVEKKQLTSIFGTSLIILLGKHDDEYEKRGHLRSGPMLDAQGPHRYARGLHFYRTAKDLAKSKLKSHQFNWQLKTVPNVGHSYREMSTAAAELLYGARQ